MHALVFLATLFGGTVILSASCFWLAARWVKAAGVSYSRALWVVVALNVVNIVVQIMFGYFERVVPDLSLALSLIAAVLVIVTQVWIDCKIISSICSLPMRKSVAVFFAGFVPAGIVCLALVLLVIRPFWTETYVIPTNSMAPTLVGEHRTATCPRCGGELIVPVPLPYYNPATIEAICSACLRTSTVKPGEGPIKQRDRMLVDKQLEPKRWDPVIFHVHVEESPGEVNFAKRIVGLPGEVVFIKDGGIWVNGSRIELPAELQGLQYVEEPGDEVFGSAHSPWRLGDDEYCVLGDFSAVSKDSRFIGPIARKDIIGVVVARYWPVPRWKIFQ